MFIQRIISKTGKLQVVNQLPAAYVAIGLSPLNQVDCLVLSPLDNFLTLNTSLVFMYAESCFFADFLLNILGKTDFRAPYMPLSASESYGYCFV